MSNEKYHYESGAIHNDNHKELNIGHVSEKALSDFLRSFLKDDAEDAEIIEEIKGNSASVSRENVSPTSTPEIQDTFADRVKAIMRKAATKNGQRIESNARGNACAYIYNVNADAFCKAMDEMVRLHSEKLKAYLGGTMQCVQVTKVCFWIGNVIRMHVINDVNLQMVDILFAFEGYYDNLQTVNAKLGDKKKTSEQNVILGTFEGLLRKFTA